MNDVVAEQNVPELTNRFLRILRTLMVIALFNVPDEMAEELNTNELRILQFVHKYPGVPQRDIANQLNMSPSAVSNAINEMEAMGLLERHKDMGDARLALYYLRPTGQRLIREAQNAQFHSAINLLGELPFHQQLQVVQALERALLEMQNKTNLETSYTHG